MTRLREAYDTLNQTFPLAWSPDSLIDAMQTGDRLSYYPETISQEIAYLHATLPKIIQDVHAMQNAITPQEKEQIARTLGDNWQHSVADRLAAYQGLVARAAAQLQDAISAPTKSDTAVK